MPDLVYGEAPTAEQRIAVLYVWARVHADGGEGILSADLPLIGSTIRHAPLMSSKRDVAEQLRPVARQVQRDAMHLNDRFVRIELREFRLVPNGAVGEAAS
jgi:hypothetical protein